MADIEAFIGDLNDTWQARRFDDLRAFFDARVALLRPDSSELAVGVDAMVASYREFLDTATVHGFETVSLEVADHEGFAMCHLRFRLDYEVADGRFTAEGLEVCAVATTGPAPRIVWRTQLPV